MKVARAPLGTYVLAVSTGFFDAWHQMRSTENHFAVAVDGSNANTPAGAFIRKLSMACDPPGTRPDVALRAGSASWNAGPSPELP